MQLVETLELTIVAIVAILIKSRILILIFKILTLLIATNFLILKLSRNFYAYCIFY